MKKFIRGTYIWGLYVLAIPFAVLVMLIFMVYSLYTVIRGYSSIKDIKAYLLAAWEGFKTGHEVNMYWVKTGKNQFEWLIDKSEGL